MFSLDCKLDWKKALSSSLALNAFAIRKTNHQRKKRGVTGCDGWLAHEPPSGLWSDRSKQSWSPVACGKKVLREG